jgi:repressor LexA
MRRAGLPDPSLWEIAEAGGPILADESVDDVIPLPKQLVGEGTFLMLSVVGESMINAAITGGDWVVVRRDSDVGNGDIVAALVESETGREVAVRTFKEIDGHVWLFPHNPVYSPVMADDAVIIGKVVTVLRRM